MHRAITALAALVLVTVSAVVPLSAPVSAAAVVETPAVLYVATDGDDASPCAAFGAPCLTVGGAVTRAHEAITDGVIDVTVHIAAGTYDENVTIGAVASGHSLSLLGAGRSATIIDGLGNASTPASVVTVASGTVNIGSLSITGGYAQSGGGIYSDAATLRLSDSTVSGSTATGSGAAQGGGGIHNNTGTLNVVNTTVSGNTATGLNTLAGGGGIFNNAGALAVSDSIVSNNAATTGYAGGIFNSTGTVSVSSSRLSGNTGWYVGGIYNRGTLNLFGSTLSDNISTKNFGGGIGNVGTMTVTSSTLSGNSALNASLGKGGAIHNKGLATVANSTLSGNSAYQGGGIFTQSKLLTISNSTFSGNTHTVTLAGAVRPGGGIWVDGSPFVNLSNSILSGSSCNQQWAVDGGHNVIDDSSCFATIGTSITGSTTIGLAPLAANGSTGPLTMAIDSTSSAHHLVPGCTGTDARGLARPGFGGAAKCDAGAYELQGVAPTVTADPQSKTFAIGSDATFTAIASGIPVPTVQWQAYTGTAWADVSGATATTLTVTGVTLAMSGIQYRAVFTNGVTPAATTAAAILTVPVGAPDNLVVSPSSRPIVAGGSMTVTAAAIPEVALPEVALPANKPIASGPLTGVPATIQPGGRFIATATGFAPHAPVTFGIYSTPLLLGKAIADSNGTAVAQLQISAEFTGSHTVIAAGMGPSQTVMYLEDSIFVEQPAAPAAADPKSPQPTTENGSDLNPLTAGGFLLLVLVLGSLIGVVVYRRHRIKGRTSTGSEAD